MIKWITAIVLGVLNLGTLVVALCLGITAWIASDIGVTSKIGITIFLVGVVGALGVLDIVLLDFRRKEK